MGCPMCGGVGKILVQDGVDVFSQRCENCGSGVEAAQRIEKSGIPNRFSDASLEAWKRPGVDPKAAAAADSFSADDEWLVVCGPTGTGKTHLLSSITRDMIARGHRAKYVSLLELFLEGRQSLGGGEKDRFRALHRACMGIPVLALDDLGAGRGTDYETNLSSEIVELRYSRGLLTVVGTPFRLSGPREHTLAGAGRLLPGAAGKLQDASSVVTLLAQMRSAQ